MSKCLSQKIDVSVAPTSSLLDTNVAIEEKLYGYHRLENPPVVYLEQGELNVGNLSDVLEEKVPSGVSGRKDIDPPEPEKY